MKNWVKQELSQIWLVHTLYTKHTQAHNVIYHIHLSSSMHTCMYHIHTHTCIHTCTHNLTTHTGWSWCWTNSRACPYPCHPKKSWRLSTKRWDLCTCTLIHCWNLKLVTDIDSMASFSGIPQDILLSSLPYPILIAWEAWLQGGRGERAIPNQWGDGVWSKTASRIAKEQFAIGFW